ncbi:MAG: IS21 family transposase [Bacteroidaceae bacterium]|nr:IS21 family transposase [Bacteroidaceae bacterium]
MVLGVNRSTVHRYQAMSEQDFNELLHRESIRHCCKLDGYRDFIVNELHDAPFLSSPQILDHLKEHFEDFPEVSEKTVYNYVMRIREEEDIPKQGVPSRQTRKLPELEYGEQAQVDWGEQWMTDGTGNRVKVWFFCMIMSRSRMRFVCLRNTPFTSKSTVYAHHLAFLFFGGTPRQVLYDQDRKMLVRENFGDYLQTEEFARYVAEAGYESVYAMAADPQTKGKVENLVKYVKINFLRGRSYPGIDALNEQCIGWLARTANAKVHATTKLIPAEEFELERKHLRPYTVTMDEPDMEAKPYTVRSDNTILYRSNTYSLPLGTYTGKGAKVLVLRNEDADELGIYNLELELITTHRISPLKGKHISKEGHVMSQSRDVLEAENLLREHLSAWDDQSLLSRFLSALKTDRPRYYRKSVMKMSSILTDYDTLTARALLEIYAEHKVYNANRMEEIAKDMCNRMENTGRKTIVVPLSVKREDITPEKRSIEAYRLIIGEGDEG